MQIVKQGRWWMNSRPGASIVSVHWLVKSFIGVFHHPIQRTLCMGAMENRTIVVIEYNFCIERLSHRVESVRELHRPTLIHEFSWKFLHYVIVGFPLYTIYGCYDSDTVDQIKFSRSTNKYGLRWLSMEKLQLNCTSLNEYLSEPIYLNRFDHRIPYVFHGKLTRMRKYTRDGEIRFPFGSPLLLFCGTVLCPFQWPLERNDYKLISESIIIYISLEVRSVQSIYPLNPPQRSFGSWWIFRDPFPLIIINTGRWSAIMSASRSINSLEFPLRFAYAIYFTFSKPYQLRRRVCLLTCWP